MAIAIGGSYVPTSGGSNPMVLTCIPKQVQVHSNAVRWLVRPQMQRPFVALQLCLQSEGWLFSSNQLWYRWLGKEWTKKHIFPKTIQIFVVPSKNDNHTFALPLVPKRHSKWWNEKRCQVSAKFAMFWRIIRNRWVMPRPLWIHPQYLYLYVWWFLEDLCNSIMAKSPLTC